MTIVLDAGGLLAIDRGRREIMALLRVAQQDAVPVVTSAAAVAQVWRDGGRQAVLVRMLRGIDEHPVDQAAARAIGALLQRSATRDVVDAHVATLATTGDSIATSDSPDIRHLLETRGADVRLIEI